MRILIAALLVTGCAGCGSTNSQTKPAPAWACGIQEPVWASWEDAFDRARTLELVARLRAAAESDRAQIKADPNAQPGTRLAEIVRQTTGDTTFVSNQAADLGLRLRQLECAVRRGTWRARPGTIDKIYAEIIGEMRKVSEQL